MISRPESFLYLSHRRKRFEDKLLYSFYLQFGAVFFGFRFLVTFEAVALFWTLGILFDKTTVFDAGSRIGCNGGRFSLLFLPIGIAKSFTSE